MLTMLLTGLDETACVSLPVPYETALLRAVTMWKLNPDLPLPKVAETPPSARCEGLVVQVLRTAAPAWRALPCIGQQLAEVKMGTRPLVVLTLLPMTLWM